MNKNLRLSLIAVVCSLAITACSSSNKGATRYENLVKNKTEEAIKKAEEIAKRAQDSETAKKLADLEKKKKELEAELAKKQNDNADAVEKKEPVVVNPTDKVLTAEEAKKALEKAFTNNELNGSMSYLNGIKASFNTNTEISHISKDEQQNLNKLVIDGHTISLFADEDLIKHASEQVVPKEVNTINTDDSTIKTGALPSGKYRDNFDRLRYGYHSKNGKTTLFVQGYMTPTNSNDSKTSAPHSWYGYSTGNTNKDGYINPLPTSGILEYSGKAFYGKNGNYNEFNTIAYADFSNKKVRVDIKDGEVNKLTFGGKITENSFAGNYQGIETKGAFFGNKGSDIGGIFYQTSKGSEPGYNGVFGATRTDCGNYGCGDKASASSDLIKDFNISE
ncbi:transferrin-binding protein-like solute binding protein [Actinobacillus equuli]|uniref:transferrin-binding protein-like solute binding protein n=1 Tax=Actinobacillus equuli TaxID=718 RepID=UPI0024424389|nr:transferrin-binding protein-like solute binding protein [Actinobacillus equuli]WGE64704.1 transferrin-binding protein-like solute binding protein [Actinobacillus equuli subsp. equuli]WGE78665.1 transferrin-binding protein-like solute binding protein [Actinobacillus equuli subsp. equuli]